MVVILPCSIYVSAGHLFPFWMSAVNRNYGRLQAMIQVFECRVVCEFSLLT